MVEPHWIVYDYTDHARPLYALANGHHANGAPAIRWEYVHFPFAVTVVGARREGLALFTAREAKALARRTRVNNPRRHVMALGV